MLLGVFEDVFEQLAADVIAHGLAMGDRVLQVPLATQLGLQIAAHRFHGGLADHELSQVLQVRQAPQRQHPLDQLVGVLHLLDGLVVFMLGHAQQAPVLEHPGVQEILVDGGQFHLELGIEERDDLLVALHGKPWSGEGNARQANSLGPQKGGCGQEYVKYC
jgi:hypothetical protein